MIAGKAIGAIAPPRRSRGGGQVNQHGTRGFEQFGIDHRTWQPDPAPAPPRQCSRAEDTAIASRDSPAAAGHARRRRSDDLSLGTELLFEGASSANKSIILWGECALKIFNSPGRDEVIATDPLARQPPISRTNETRDRLSPDFAFQATPQAPSLEGNLADCQPEVSPRGDTT